MQDTERYYAELAGELRAQMARRGETVASLARQLEDGDADRARKTARRLRRQLRGDQDMRLSDLLSLIEIMDMTLTIGVIEREDPM